MDIQYLLWLQELRNATGGAMDAFFEFISDFVHGTYAYLMMAAIYWCIDKKAGIMIAMNVGFGNVANQTLKNICCVYRPWIRDARIVPAGNSMQTATGYSFPSGHTQLATAEFGTIAVWQRRRKWLATLCVVMIMLVMFSRNYLGVHTPQDVIVSCALCSLVIFADYRLMRWMEAKQNRDLLVLGAGLVICAIYLVFFTLKSYPVDYAVDGSILVDPAKMITDCYSAAGCAVGFLIGWILERRLVKFEPMQKVWQKMICFIAGAVLLALVMKAVCEPLYAAMKEISMMGSYFGKMLYYIIAYVFIMAGFPALMKLVNKFYQRKRTEK
ncbi:MAG: phosphatase PAP2 family protein [Lachnospiraceae bacterium]|nr:phosphatase PAP2 family protein [Lachnospiraceae bacterium]MDD6811189.1 phosphatase PAP2 family protein [Lachnospiraceae bacterium]